MLFSASKSGPHTVLFTETYTIFRLDLRQNTLERWIGLESAEDVKAYFCLMRAENLRYWLSRVNVALYIVGNYFLRPEMFAYRWFDVRLILHDVWIQQRWKISSKFCTVGWDLPESNLYVNALKQRENISCVSLFSFLV